MKAFIVIAALVVMLGVAALAYLFLRGRHNPFDPRSASIIAWFNDPAAHADWVIQPNTRCGDAPFQFPTTGMAGYLWDDSFRIGHRHQGIDIFSGGDAGVTPVYAAYDGYLTRLPDWKSTVIVRIPSDPLQPGRQIWTYYTHMADTAGNSFVAAEFPPGTSEVFVSAGTLLGYQGNYSGDPNNPTGVHLHLSIVKDDGQGKFLNELDINNTLDPSPYFNLPLNGKENRERVPVCQNGG